METRRTFCNTASAVWPASKFSILTSNSIPSRARGSASTNNQNPENIEEADPVDYGVPLSNSQIGPAHTRNPFLSNFYLWMSLRQAEDGERSNLSLDLRNVIYSVYDLLGSR